MKNQNLETMRHSCSHVMAAAVLKFYPKVKFGIGPAIEDGFYYDFDFPKPITENDLEKISTSMIHFIEAKLPFEKQEVSINEAKKIFKNQPYKLELIEELAAKGAKKVSTYQAGEFIDLCTGPHVKKTSEIGPFKLLSIAGAYWRGNEVNPMLTRIYGTCFPTEKELNDYLKFLEEVKKRDHRKLAKELDLVSQDESVGAGIFLWHPKASIIRTIIEDFWKEVHRKWGYQYIYTPHIGKLVLWKTSGHWDFYRESMYPPIKADDGEYLIKPMSCPFHILVYKTHPRSYRELPIRFNELGTVYRYEKSGTLHGLLRVRGFTQDDAHIFCRDDQLKDELINVLNLSLYMLKNFGFEKYKIELSTRDPVNKKKFMGDDKIWDKAEKALKEALEAKKLKYEVMAGEAKFYGPAIDIKLMDALGRGWQGPTIQLDFNLPEKFDVSYIGENGRKHRAIMIHRTVLGCMERFLGNLIEHYTGAFPVWLSPVQAIIIPITERQNDYGKKLLEKLQLQNIRAELDNRGETASAKIRDAELQKIPYILVVGDREIKDSTVNVRVRGEKVLGPMVVEKFVKLIKEDIDKKRQV